MSAHRTSFPFFRFAGSHGEIGRQYGEECRDLIVLHRDLALERLQMRSGIDRDRALADALAYRPFVVDHAPFFDEEAQGLAESSGLALAEIYLLQLRAELAVISHDAAGAESPDECTTFALVGDAGVGGETIIGQNADLPAFYRDVSLVAELRFNDMPSVLMLLPAGQLSYIGINDAGVGICANYLVCDGWRYGFPRYLLSRLALTQSSAAAGAERIRNVPRASSRNMLIADAAGTAIDLETTPTRAVGLTPREGILVHANHYVSPELLGEERSMGRHLANSHVRHRQMQVLLTEKRGHLDLASIETIMRDRACHPDCLSREADDDSASDTITFASMIGELGTNRLHVAIGPPHQHTYVSHAFSVQSEPAAATLATGG